jgi:queuine tRNA-ribosyltransferase
LWQWSPEGEALPDGPRLGALRLAHGDVRTPVFMPVGTQGTVKALHPDDLKALGAEIILGNAYHLYLRPGHELIERLGGLHAFMQWDRPILTDSGGFQVFSLGHLRKVDEEGVTFRSHIDGSEHRLTPELAIAVQRALGSDICMALDVVAGAEAGEGEQRDAMARTHRWAERCRRAVQPGQVLFGIAQGGFDATRRTESALTLSGMDFPGYAIGGLSVGEAKELTWRMLAASLEGLAADRPRYLMGVGSPEDLVTAIGMGVDMFDCVLPTRLARNGALFTLDGRVNITAARWREERGPVDGECDCETCKTFSAAYLHHLFRAEELLAYRLASVHNLRFLVRLVERAREAIAASRYDDFARGFLGRYRTTEHEVRLEQRRKWVSARERRATE